LSKSGRVSGGRVESSGAALAIANALKENLNTTELENLKLKACLRVYH
jgi:hypothetical protein